MIIITFLSFFYACQRESEDDLRQEHKLENLGNKLFEGIDVEIYDSLVKRDDFRTLAMLYKENKDAIYTCADEELLNQCLKADTIRSLISYYSRKFSCLDLSLYIAKYVDSEFTIQSRCLLNEKVEDCWKRAWDLYDRIFINKIFRLVKNPNDIINDIQSFLSGSYGTFGVRRVFVLFQDKKNRPSVEMLKLQKNGLVNFLYSRGIGITPIFSDSDIPNAEHDVHSINECLNDGFYWYYTSNRWKNVAELKKDPNACPFCDENPCICENICPQCKYKIKNCMCCKKCGFYPCRCYAELTPAWGPLEFRPYISAFWRDQKIGAYLESLSVPTKYCTLLDWKIVSSGRPTPLRTNLDRVYTEPYGMSNLGLGYSACILYTNMKFSFDLVDIYSFAKSVNSALHDLQTQGYPNDYIGPLFAFFVFDHEVYALASRGKLGLLGAALSEEKHPYRLDHFEFNIDDIAVDKTITHDGRIYHYGFDCEYEKKLYQAMKLFQQMNCDIEIFKLKKGNNITTRDEFMKGWYSSGFIRGEEDLK